jgi:predicted RNase H-like nuclease
VRFVGISLAWRPGEAENRPSCLVVLDERGSIIANSFAGSPEEIRGSVEAYAEDRRGVIVGLDAPLAVPNERGTRKTERILSRVSLPAPSASRKMFDDSPYSEDVLAALAEVEVVYTDYPMPRQRGYRMAVEVDAAATLKVLSLERTGAEDPSKVPEPKLRKGNREARAAVIKNAVDILWNTPGLRLRTGNLSSDLQSSENVDLSKLDVDPKMSHAELDRVVDLVEGTLAAYTVHRHWRGRDGSMVVGLGDEGSVLLPASGALQERIAEECRTAKVPYV